MIPPGTKQQCVHNKLFSESLSASEASRSLSFPEKEKTLEARLECATCKTKMPRKLLAGENDGSVAWKGGKLGGGGGGQWPHFDALSMQPVQLFQRVRWAHVAGFLPARQWGKFERQHRLHSRRKRAIISIHHGHIISIHHGHIFSIHHGIRNVSTTKTIKCSMSSLSAMHTGNGIARNHPLPSFWNANKRVMGSRMLLAMGWINGLQWQFQQWRQRPQT
jgi:hypothetical protein